MTCSAQGGLCAGKGTAALAIAPASLPLKRIPGMGIGRSSMPWESGKGRWGTVQGCGSPVGPTEVPTMQGGGLA